MDRDTAEPTVSSLPGERAREWVDRHHEFAAPSTYVYEFVWDHSAPADGPFCTDVDGNVLLDFTSHVCGAPLGYNNPVLGERLAEFDLVDPTKIAGQDFYVASGPVEDHPIPGPTDLMERLTDRTSHYGLDTVFLSNSGAEAVENAIKICYDHTGGRYAITFEKAFHGRTLGALSLNRSKRVHRRGFPELSGVHDVPFCDDRTCDPESCSCGFFAGGTSQLRRMLDPREGSVDPDEVAYLILEPIQGEGGYRFPSDAFAAEVAAVCEEHDLLLVADEIQSGVGRTGEMWGADHYPIEPDVITSAKGLRVGATVASSDVFPEETGRLSSTWGGGDVLAAAQGAITLDVIDEEDLMDNAVDRGRQFREALADADLPGATDVRGKGLMLGVEFESRDRRDAVMAAAMKRGLLTLGCGRRTLRVLPPLDVTGREIDIGVDLLTGAVEDTA
jgi:4-aminobutyrate aminotransferase